MKETGEISSRAPTDSVGAVLCAGPNTQSLNSRLLCLTGTAHSQGSNITPATSPRGQRAERWRVCIGSCQQKQKWIAFCTDPNSWNRKFGFRIFLKTEEKNPQNLQIYHLTTCVYLEISALEYSHFSECNHDVENFFSWFSQLQHTLAHRQSHPLPRCIPGPPASLSQASGEKKKKKMMIWRLCSYKFCPVLDFPSICFYSYTNKQFQRRKNQRKKIQRKKKKRKIFTLPRIYSEWAGVERRNDVSSDGKGRRGSGVSSLKGGLEQTAVISNFTAWVFA